MRFDLLILGDTPDAWTAAETAARLGRRTAVLRPDPDGRGSSIGVGAVLRNFAHDSAPPECPTTPAQLYNEAVARHERAVAAAGRHLGIRSWRGGVRLTAEHSAEVVADGVRVRFDADRVLIAAGTVARRPRGLALDRGQLILPEELHRTYHVPPRLAVLGGSRTARAVGRLFAAAGSSVTLIDAPCGPGLEAAAGSRLRTVAGEVSSLRQKGDGTVIRLDDGREIAADAVLFAANRPGATETLDLDSAGLGTDEDRRIWCDDTGQTWIPSIAAAGEIVGYPRWLREAESADAIVRALLEMPTSAARRTAVAS